MKERKLRRSTLYIEKSSVPVQLVVGMALRMYCCIRQQLLADRRSSSGVKYQIWSDLKNISIFIYQTS